MFLAKPETEWSAFWCRSSHINNVYESECIVDVHEWAGLPTDGECDADECVSA